MRGRACLLAVVMLPTLVACATEPSEMSITGQWGAAELEFIATSRTATLLLPCQAQARFSGPIHADGAGRFRLAGTVVQRYGSSHVRVSGLVNGVDLSLTLEFTYAGGGRQTQSNVLRPGVRPDFSQSVCFA